LQTGEVAELVTARAQRRDAVLARRAAVKTGPSACGGCSSGGSSTPSTRHQRLLLRQDHRINPTAEEFLGTGVI
jgi:hypothetical protein